MQKVFNPYIPIERSTNGIGFCYGDDVFGPVPECRFLDDIRESLMNPACDGPEIVYSIVMDVGKVAHKQMLQDRMLLFGVVTYSEGRLGNEPIRSQGHIHKVSTHSGWSPPEVYEIWKGKAIIYMQETAKDNPGRCFAVYAEPGDVVMVPPNWAHATISADPNQPLTFGAWCDREYGFEYDEVRAHQGLAWYPLINSQRNDEFIWEHNQKYHKTELIVKRPEDYSQFGIRKGVPIYKQFEENPEKFQFVSQPFLMEKEWKHFIP